MHPRTCFVIHFAKHFFCFPRFSEAFSSQVQLAKRFFTARRVHNRFVFRWNDSTPKKMCVGGGGRGSGEREVVFPDFKAMLVRPPFHTHRVALFVVLSPKEMSDSFTSSCLCFCIVLSVVCICVHCRDFPGVQLSF